MSILRNGYMAEALAELKRDAGKLWVKPNFVSNPGYYGWYGADLLIKLRCDGMAIISPIFDNRWSMEKDYTPARFRAALRKIKKGGEK